MVSTGTTDRNEALEVCSKYSALAAQKKTTEGVVPPENSGELVEAGLQLIQAARRGEFGEATARDFVNRVLKATKIETQLEATTTRKFFTTWLEGKKLRRSGGTALRYGTTISMFMDFLGTRADLSIAAISPADVENFRNRRLKEVGHSTVADDLRIVRMVFRSALKRGHITLNPADTELVEKPDFTSQSRNPFTPGEIVLLLNHAPKEWKPVIALGAYSGCRLGDAASMKWESVDFENGVLRYRQMKTKKDMEVPMHPDLQSILEDAAGDEGGFISPSLATQVISGRSGLSRQFIQIVRDAGLDLEVVEAQKRDGKVIGRSFTKRSFHSLRVSFASILANNEVAPELRKKLTGHKSDAVHSRYTKLEMATLRKAINQIPTSQKKSAPKRDKPKPISRRTSRHAAGETAEKPNRKTHQ
jgi:integrase